MDKRLSQLLQLSKQTGDRLIVLPEKGGEPFVLLSLADYQQLRATPIPVVAADSLQPEPSVLSDNYEFEPVAYEESEGNEAKQ